MEEFSFWGDVSPLICSPLVTEASLEPPAHSPYLSDANVDNSPLHSPVEYDMTPPFMEEAEEGGLEELDPDEAPYYEETPRQLVGYTCSGRPVYSVKRLLVPYPGKEHQEDMVEYSQLPDNKKEAEEEEESSDETSDGEEESDEEYEDSVDAESATETESDESGEENEIY